MPSEYIPKSIHIRNEVWKRITSVIRDYYKIKKEYNMLINDPHPKSIRLIATWIKICAVEKALDDLDAEKTELIRQRYYKHKAYRDIHVPMSESTMKRYTRQFVIEVGKNLGEL